MGADLIRVHPPNPCKYVCHFFAVLCDFSGYAVKARLFRAVRVMYASTHLFTTGGGPISTAFFEIFS
jgi:hypothetical protein